MNLASGLFVSRNVWRFLKATKTTTAALLLQEGQTSSSEYLSERTWELLSSFQINILHILNCWWPSSLKTHRPKGFRFPAVCWRFFRNPSIKGPSLAKAKHWKYKRTYICTGPGSPGASKCLVETWNAEETHFTQWCGSGGSVCFLASRILLSSSKHSKKNLDYVTVSRLLYDLLSLKNYVNGASKVKSKNKNFIAVFKVTDENSRIQIR